MKIETDKPLIICPGCREYFVMGTDHLCGQVPTAPADHVNDRQVGGSHYRSGYQHWDLVADLGWNYLEGCASKYITRRKDNRRQDLEKSVHYLEKQMKIMAPRPNGLLSFRNLDMRLEVVSRFSTENNLTYLEHQALVAIDRSLHGPARDRVKDILDRELF